MTVLEPFDASSPYRLQRLGVGFSSEYKTSERVLGMTLVPSEDSITRRSVEEIFLNLMQKWKSETEFHSSTTNIVLNPAYQQIIGLGVRAVPLILSELEKGPDHWFWALQSITGENPVSPEKIGNIRAMTTSWLDWGHSRGYI